MDDFTILVGPTLRKLEAAKTALDRRIAAVRLALGGGVTPGPRPLRDLAPLRCEALSCGLKVHSTKRRAYRRRKAA